MPTFPFVEVSGDDYTMGFELGRSVPDMIRRSVRQVIDYELEGAFTAEIIAERLERYRELAAGYCPALLDEVRGIADGAGIPIHEALLLQVRSDVRHAGGCTSFAVARDCDGDGSLFIGQNWDYPLDDEVVIVLRKNPSNGPRQLMMTFAGCCAYMGINSAGISQFATALPWPPGPVRTDDRETGSEGVAIPHYFYKWRVFKAESLNEVRAIAAQTVPKLGGSYMLSDSSGEIACVELCPGGAEWLPCDGSFCVHTNTHLSDKNAFRQDMPLFLEDSIPRYRRAFERFSKLPDNANRGDIAAILGDHDGYPVSICRHQPYPSYATSASLIAEPRKGLLHVCAGNPCIGEYRTYSVS